MAKADLTAQRLREVLHYDPETGLFTALYSSSWDRQAGQPVGCLSMPNGYVLIWLDRRSYRAHRLAWLYMTGEWPTDVIDHINGVKHDNRFVNLRDVPREVNMQNIRRANRNSSHGVLGAYAKGSRWVAAITVKGKTLTIGSFATIDEAHAAYLAAKRKHHPGCLI